MVRDILAVVAGFAAWTVLWLSYNAALRRFGVVPADETSPVRAPRALLMLLGGSVVFSLVAGYAVALIAQSSTYVPAIVLCGLLVATGAFVQSRVWRLMPVWYHLSFIVLLTPATLAGAWLRLA